MSLPPMLSIHLIHPTQNFLPKLDCGFMSLINLLLPISYSLIFDIYYHCIRNVVLFANYLARHTFLLNLLGICVIAYMAHSLIVYACTFGRSYHICLMYYSICIYPTYLKEYVFTSNLNALCCPDCEDIFLIGFVFRATSNSFQHGYFFILK